MNFLLSDKRVLGDQKVTKCILETKCNFYWEFNLSRLKEEWVDSILVCLKRFWHAAFQTDSKKSEPTPLECSIEDLFIRDDPNEEEPTQPELEIARQFHPSWPKGERANSTRVWFQRTIHASWLEEIRADSKVEHKQITASF